jgi:hypothetical protein
MEIRYLSRRSIAWLGRTSDLYRIVSELGDKGVSFKVLGIPALIAEFENDIRRERRGTEA